MHDLTHLTAVHLSSTASESSKQRSWWLARHTGFPSLKLSNILPTMLRKMSKIYIETSKVKNQTGPLGWTTVLFGLFCHRLSIGWSQVNALKAKKIQRYCDYLTTIFFSADIVQPDQKGMVTFAVLMGFTLVLCLHQCLLWINF